MVKYANAAGVAARIPVPNGPRRRGNAPPPKSLGNQLQGLDSHILTQTFPYFHDIMLPLLKLSYNFLCVLKEDVSCPGITCLAVLCGTM